MGQKETRETWTKELHGAQLCAKKKKGGGRGYLDKVRVWKNRNCFPPFPVPPLFTLLNV